MYKLVCGFSFLAIIGMSSCQKEQTLQKEQALPSEQALPTEQKEETLVENGANKNSEITEPGSQSSKVLLEKNLKVLNDYLNNSETRSGNTFFNYWVSNPTSTLNELESAGFINKATMLKMFSRIEDGAMTIGDDQVVWDLISKNVDSRFIDDGNSDTVATKIVIFRCTGCFDGIRRNACYESFIWSWGPGC